MTLAEAVAKRLMELCEERSYSLNQFATISGISHSTLQSLIDGQSQDPKITTIKKICDGFDMKPHMAERKVRRSGVKSPLKRDKESIESE